jgi:CheY-like chemotaxis protein
MMKVLVVDDNRFLVSTIQTLLEDEGISVMAAHDGLGGYIAYHLFQPDLIITDIQMPGENGLKMMERIRAHNPLIKTVYMSGNMNLFRPFLEQEKKRYPVHLFEKPFSLDVLRALISEPAGNFATSC